jgi:hypothetical protein
MPWPGDPRVNLQAAENGKAKAYQVRQLLAAIDRLEMMHAQQRKGAGEIPAAPATTRRPTIRHRE